MAGQGLLAGEQVSVFAGSVFWVSMGPQGRMSSNPSSNRCALPSCASVPSFRRKRPWGAYCGHWGGIPNSCTNVKNGATWRRWSESWACKETGRLVSRGGQCRRCSAVTWCQRDAPRVTVSCRPTWRRLCRPFTGSFASNALVARLFHSAVGQEKCGNLSARVTTI